MRLGSQRVMYGNLVNVTANAFYPKCNCRYVLSQARALVFSGSPDVPATYNSVMNAIFSAQKAGVLVDCAVLGESSTFLQQAAYLTGATCNNIGNICGLDLVETVWRG